MPSTFRVPAKNVKSGWLYRYSRLVTSANRALWFGDFARHEKKSENFSDFF